MTPETPRRPQRRRTATIPQRTKCPTILQHNSYNQLGDLTALHELLHYITTSNCHFALLQETGTIKHTLPPHLRLICSGRTAILYHASYSVKTINVGTFSSPQLDATEIEVTMPNRTKFRLCSFYRPPTIQGTTTPYQPLLKYLSTRLNTSQNIIIGGDSNIHSVHLGSKANHPAAASRLLWNLISSMESGGCLNNGSPTRFGLPNSFHKPTPSAIDITLWNSDNVTDFQPTSWSTGTQLTSDHKTILFNLHFLETNLTPVPTLRPPQKTFKPNRTIKDKQHALQQLSLQPCPELLTVHPSVPLNVDQLANKITSTLQSAALKHSLIKPLNSSTTVPLPRHYNWSPECQQEHQRANKLASTIRRLKRHPTTNNQDLLTAITQYKQARQQLRITLQKTKRDSWQQVCQLISSETPTKTMWRTFHRLSKRRPNTNYSLPAIQEPNKEPAVHPSDQASALAHHFQQISSTSNIPPLANYNLTHFEAIHADLRTNANPNEAIHPPETDNPISMNEITSALSNLNLKSSPGNDAISYEIILHATNIHDHILELFNQSYDTGLIPSEWKLAELIPLPKKPNATAPNDYRPISLLPCIGKLMEKIILNRLTKELDTKDLNNPYQSGFVKYRSTTNQILRVTQIIHDEWQKDNDVVFIALDISKAFDSVWQAGLKYKLRNNYGIQGKLLQWLSNFLSNRQAYVQTSNHYSQTFPLENSVPQGSILAATLFAMYISDLTTTIPPSTPPALYADDLTILCPISRQHGHLRQLQLKIAQQALDNVTTWGSTWRLYFHKSQLLVFTPHGSDSVNTQPNEIQLRLHNQPISLNQSDPVRLLGVWLDPHLSMKAHIDKIIARVQPRIHFLRSVSSKSWGADRTTLLLLYKSWIRPIIEYASTAYAIASPKTLKKLDSLQAQALRIIVGSSKAASITALHAILNIHTLGTRRLRTATKLYAKYQRGDTRDACISHWRQWTSDPRNTNRRQHNHTSNLFHPTRFQSNRSPFSFILHAASILDIPNRDICPEPLIPTDPHFRYPTTTPTHPDDALTDYPTFGSATSRTPTQLINAHDFSLSTIDAYKISLPDTSQIIFTDGSLNSLRGGGAGIGIVAYRPNGHKVWSQSKPTLPLSTSYATELLAIEQALIETQSIVQRDPTHTTSIVILSDCQAAVNTAKQPIPRLNKYDYWKTRQRILNTKMWLRQHNVRVQIDWIPGHCNIAGNDAADLLSKNAADKHPTNTSTHIPLPMSAVCYHINTATNHLSDLLILSSNKCKALFSHTLDNIPKPNENIYKTLKLNRRSQVTIDRLLIGDHLFNNRLHHLDLSIPPLCDNCPAMDSIHHRLLQCPKYQHSRTLLLQNIRSIPSIDNNIQLSLPLLLAQPQLNEDARTRVISHLSGFLRDNDLEIRPHKNLNPNILEPP